MTQVTAAVLLRRLLWEEDAVARHQQRRSAHTIAGDLGITFGTLIDLATHLAQDGWAHLLVPYPELQLEAATTPNPSGEEKT